MRWLVRNHHVYAVDVSGHGQSDRLAPGGYTNAHIGALLAEFLETIVGAPAIVSGHSSGGLLALWLAARRPDLVRGLLLEDPPLFSSIPPRAGRTTGAVLPRLATAPDGPRRRLPAPLRAGEWLLRLLRAARTLDRPVLAQVDRRPPR